MLEHQFGKSLLRSTWKVTDADGGEVVTAQERSLPMAIARRVVDFVPYGEWLPIPYNFDLLMDGRVIGHMNRKFQLRDRYVLDLSGDHERKLDRRARDRARDRPGHAPEPLMGKASDWLREERRKVLGDWVAFCLGCGAARRWFDDFEARCRRSARSAAARCSVAARPVRLRSARRSP